MRHHEEPGDVQTELSRMLHMLAGDIGFRTMGGNPHRPGSGVHSAIQIVYRPDARYQQNGYLGSANGLRHRANPLHVGVRADSIIETRSREPVAMGNLDSVHTGIVERFGYLRHLLDRIAMPDGMHPIAQSYILNI